MDSLSQESQSSKLSDKTGHTQAYRILDYQTQSLLYGTGSGICLVWSGIFSFLLYKQKKEIENVTHSEPMYPDELIDLIRNQNRQLTQSNNQEQVFSLSRKFIVKGEVNPSQISNSEDSAVPKHIESLDMKNKLVYSQISKSKVFLLPNQEGQNVLDKRVELVNTNYVDQFALKKSNLNESSNSQQKPGFGYKREDFKLCRIINKVSKGKINFERGSKEKKTNQQQQSQSSEQIAQPASCEIRNFGNVSTNKEKALEKVSQIDKFNESIKAHSKIKHGNLILLGFSSAQVGIKFSDSIMAYGEIIIDLPQQLIILDTPQVIAKTKSQIEDIISSNYTLKSILSFFLLSIGMFYGYKAVVSYLKHRKILTRMADPTDRRPYLLGRK